MNQKGTQRTLSLLSELMVTGGLNQCHQLFTTYEPVRLQRTGQTKPNQKDMDIKKNLVGVVVAHAFYPSTWEAWEGRSP